MSDLGNRIREAADRIGGLDKLASVLSGVKRRTLTDYVSGKSEPRISTIIDIANATGVSLEWLVANRGDIIGAEPVESAMLLDDWTVRRLAAVVTEVHRERKLPISPENVAVEAALSYNELVGRVSDLSDRGEIEAALSQVRYLLNKKLDEAAAEPGTGKALGLMIVKTCILAFARLLRAGACIDNATEWFGDI